MADKIKAKRCPFCGREPRVVSMRFGFEKNDRWAVTCKDCAVAIGWDDSEEEVVKRWNRRAHETD